MDTISTGDAVLANNVKVLMVDPSADSPQSDKTRTTRTAKLTPERALEILESAILKCQEAGISIGISNVYKAGTVLAVVVLEGCEVRDNHLLLATFASAGKGE